jgi:hypothetical protein
VQCRKERRKEGRKKAMDDGICFASIKDYDKVN